MDDAGQYVIQSSAREESAVAIPYFETPQAQTSLYRPQGDTSPMTPSATVAARASSSTSTSYQDFMKQASAASEEIEEMKVIIHDTRAEMPEDYERELEVPN